MQMCVKCTAGQPLPDQLPVGPDPVPFLTLKKQKRKTSGASVSTTMDTPPPSKSSALPLLNIQGG